MDAATIEEANKLRVSLGMKPLPVPGAPSTQPTAPTVDDDGEVASTLESRQAESYDNYRKVQEAEAAKKKRDEKAAAIKKARDQAQRFATLEGKGLGDLPDGGDVDAKTWLMGQKKRLKRIEKARKLEQELVAAEEQAAAALEYTSKDLAGVNVAHDMSEVLGGDDQILTLKDATIGEYEEEGDELENLSLREKERLKERLDLKKKTPGYNPLDFDRDEEQKILAKYDEEIEGKRRKKFTLDANGTIPELADILDGPARSDKSREAGTIDLDIGATHSASDYLDISDIKVKKSKKKKQKSTRQKPVDEDDIFPTTNEQVAEDGLMDIDFAAASEAKKRKIEDANIIDDDHLQAALSIQRRSALKKRKKMRPEDIARQMREEEREEAQNVEMTGNDASEGTGLVIGEASEFVAGIRKTDDEERKPRRPKQESTEVEDKPADEEPDGDHPMNGDLEIHDREQEEREESAAAEDVLEEKKVSMGLGATMALLKERGIVKANENQKTHELMVRKDEFLTQKRRLEEEMEEDARLERERLRRSGRFDKMTIREREEWQRQANAQRDYVKSKRLNTLFSKMYNPNVEIKHHDETGRQLTAKEAFKELSHQFHGKTSGNKKTDKKNKQIDEERRREAQSVLDASQNVGMSSVTAQQLKKQNQAGVRLA